MAGPPSKLLLLCLLSLLSAACGTPPPSATAARVQSKQQQWPAAKFGLTAADLPQSVHLGDAIWLHWGVAGDVMTLGVTANLPASTTYLGVGLSELGSMKGADIWLLNRTSSGWALVDAYAPGFVRPVADAHQDLKLLGVEAGSNRQLVAAWRRFLAPCDLQDLPIVADVPIHVIWAHHDRWGYHGRENRGGKIVTFITPGGSSVKTSKSQEQRVAAEAGVPGLKTLDLKYPVTIPSQTTSYFIQYFKLPSDKKYHIVKYEPIGHLPQLHHGVAYTCSPDKNAQVAALPSLGPFDRFQMNMICEQFYMLMTPNASAVVAPDAAGIPMGTPSSTWMALELHYNNPEGTAGIRDPGAGIRIHYTDKLRPQDLGLLTLNQPVLSIPPGVANYPTNASVCPGSCTKRLKGPVTLTSAFLHMHGLGKSVVVRRFRGERELSPIADLRAYDYAFQGHTPIAPDARTLQPGDALTVQCTFDSTERTSVTKGGPGTDDEMCFAWLSYYPAQEDMGLCYSFGNRPVGVCAAAFPEEQLWKVFRDPDAATKVQQMMAKGELERAAPPKPAATWKPVCTSKTVT